MENKEDNEEEYILFDKEEYQNYKIKSDGEN